MNELSTQMLLFLAGFGVFVAFGVAVVYKMALGMVPEHDKSNVAKEVIPLVAIGVIVAAIYALAVAGLVEENTVAAIFGALAGYVLGKGKNLPSSSTPDQQGQASQAKNERPTSDST